MRCVPLKRDDVSVTLIKDVLIRYGRKRATRLQAGCTVSVPLHRAWNLVESGTAEFTVHMEVFGV